MTAPALDALLLRQLARLGLRPDTAPDGASWAQLLQRVSRAYQETNQHRQLSERAMALSSQEMRTLHEQLQLGNALLEIRVQERTAELAQVHSRMAFALQSANACTWDLDVDSGQLHLSEGWATMLGRPMAPSVVALADLLAMVPAPELAHGFPNFMAALEGERDDYVLEHRVRTENGVWMWLLSHGRVTERDPQSGRALHLSGINLDITQRKLAEQALSEGQARFRALTELSTDWYWEQDAQFRFTSHVGRDLLRAGLPMSQHLGMTRWELPGAEIVGQSWAEHQAMLAAHQPFSDLTLKRCGPDGITYYVRFSGEPVFNETGEFVGYRGVSKNETARYAAELALQHQTERLKIAQAAAKMIVLDWAPQTDRLEFSEDPTWLRGPLPAGTGRYPPFKDQIHPDDREQFLAARQHALDTLQGAAPEFRLVRTDGVVLWVQSHQAVFAGADGKATRLVSAIRDISDQKRAELALREARDRAEAANISKSAFLANMSHEIRTPLNAVLGLTYLTLQREKDPGQRDYLGKIEVAGKSLLRLINDILDLSKIEAGKLTLEQAPFNLPQLLEQIYVETRLAAQAKGLRLALVLPKDLPHHWHGDALRLGQVLRNLCSNAVKFTAQGQVELNLALQATAGPANASRWLNFNVQDSGIGLSPAEQARMFQPFSQADSSTSRKYGGTGLGLSISRQLVQLMGGKLWLHSEPGRGSSFGFAVPLLPVTEPLETTLPPARTALLNGLRVLLVLGDTELMHASAAPLIRWGLQVVQAPSARAGAQALAQAVGAGTPFQLVIVDESTAGDADLMPTETRPAKVPHPPRLLLRAPSTPPDADRASAASAMSATLQTPFTPTALFDSVHRLLRPASARAENRATPSWRGARMLLVEDDLINQIVAQGLLEPTGVALEVASSGQETLAMMDAAPAQHYDLVLMDLHMPEMDGIATTQRLRQNPAWAHLPVIAMTASAMGGDRERLLAAGMNDYIAKPVSVHALYATLAPWLRPEKTPLP